jgi:hypothetical protein
VKLPPPPLLLLWGGDNTQSADQNEQLVCCDGTREVVHWKLQQPAPRSPRTAAAVAVLAGMDLEQPKAVAAAVAVAAARTAAPQEQRRQQQDQTQPEVSTDGTVQLDEVQLWVPPAYVPGNTLKFSHNGRIFETQVPDGTPPGSILHIRVPSSMPPEDEKTAAETAAETAACAEAAAAAAVAMALVKEQSGPLVGVLAKEQLLRIRANNSVRSRGSKGGKRSHPRSTSKYATKRQCQVSASKVLVVTVTISEPGQMGLKFTPQTTTAPCKLGGIRLGTRFSAM